MISELKPLLAKLAIFAKNRLKFSHPPRLFLKNDIKNSQKPLGKTAYYDPEKESVTLFVTSRHPKDILRSFAHELVHHTQNLRGDLSPEKMGFVGKNYAQDNEHMRNMEMEAYLLGNMCLRDWEDGLSKKDMGRYKLAESKFLEEKSLMKASELKQIISKLLKEAKAPENKKKDGKAKVKNPGPYMGGARQKAGIDDDGDGVPNKADSHPQDGSKGKKTKSKKKKPKSKIKKENKSMTTKITKEYLKETIRTILENEFTNEDNEEAIQEAPAGEGGPLGEIGRIAAKIRSMTTDGPGAYILRAAAKFDEFKKLRTSANTVIMVSDRMKGLNNRPLNRTAREDFEKFPEYFEAAAKKFKSVRVTMDTDAARKAYNAARRFFMQHTSDKLPQKKVSNLFAPVLQVANAKLDDLEGGPVVPSQPQAPRIDEVNLPEGENALYENRFAPRNNRLFDKLLKEWTK